MPENQSPKISIIVPVYRAEKYLHHCIESLLAQTFTDFEILLVNDGSPDHSGEICDDYAKIDHRIRVLHKNNGGVSSARQCGIDNAKGEYTIHADPDDWVEPTMLEELYSKAKEGNFDMVLCDYYICNYKNSIYVPQFPQSLECDSLLRQFLGQKLHGSLWNKLIRKSLYSLYNISFPKEIIRWEDLFIVCNILLHPIKVAYLNKAFYHYDISINENSIVRKTTESGLYSQILFVNYFSEKLPYIEYENELYRIKACTKELAFASNLRKGKELIKLYEEINDRYASTEKGRGMLHYCLAMFINGRLSYNFSVGLFKKYRQFLWGARIIKKTLMHKD